MAIANGVYTSAFVGQRGKLVFVNENRIWWIFYSSLKNSWIIASDGTPNDFS